MGETHQKPHAIVFPYPYQGHITPTINLVTNLASKGFTITYVQLDHIHHTIISDGADADPFVGARKSGLDIRYMTISDGFSLGFDRGVNLVEYWESMILNFPDRVDELVGRIVTTSSDERAAQAMAYLLIADSLYTWPATIAAKHKLVNVSFWTEPALVFSICSHLDLLRENGHLPVKGHGLDRINYIPGVESISTNDLMSFIQDPDALPILIKIVVNAFEQVKNAEFILCNTVQELEPETLSALNRKQPTCYAVGPVNFFDSSSTSTTTKSMWAQSDCTQWLKSKPPGSVLYISFGSIAQLNKHQIKEIAHGLVLSNVHFIWILSTDDDDDDDVFPVGFEDVLEDRGLLVPWCDQSAVLSDLAVGGFLTHCGWNSIVESVWNGVPMICYPFFVDQPTNRKLVVEDWKIGVNLCDEGSEVIKREEVASKIDVLMKGKTCIELREEAKKVSKVMRNALDTDHGSSRTNFDQFVHDLKIRLVTTTL